MSTVIPDPPKATLRSGRKPVPVIVTACPLHAMKGSLMSGLLRARVRFVAVTVGVLMTLWLNSGDVLPKKFAVSA